jgi:phage shock protein PspC (stress-responsive transcriptional regulator)
MSSTERPYRRLYRSRDRILCGVCGGIAEYLRVDPALVRLITVLAALINLPVAVFAYFVACFIVPEKEVVEGGTTGTAATTRRSHMKISTLIGLVMGAILLLTGMFILVEYLKESLARIVESFRWISRILAPETALIGVILLVVGALLIALSLRGHSKSSSTEGPG